MKCELNKIEFQKRLRILMEENNETIYTLAEKLNLSPATISRYSSGMSPKITTIEVLARLYNINPVWLMGYNVEKHLKEETYTHDSLVKSDEKKLLEYYRSCSKEDKEELLMSAKYKSQKNVTTEKQNSIA
jgi:transcriptional regulator with XRE-family HTH domain